MSKPIRYDFKMSNKEILSWYYSMNAKFLNVADIKKLFGCAYGKAARIRNKIQERLISEGRKELAMTGFVPFDYVLEEASLNIETIERNYKKQIKLGIS